MKLQNKISMSCRTCNERVDLEQDLLGGTDELTEAEAEA